MKQVIRIGTRRSKLSLWQANHVAGLIRALYSEARIEIREYSTRGDAISTAPLSEIGGVGLFTQALEDALRRGEIDCAVHSHKDLPVDSAADLTIGAIPARGDHRDVLLSRNGASLAELPQAARIGTGSPRRRAQLLAMRPDLQIKDIRGNVPTRVEKLLAADGAYDAIVLAAAGLNRLGMTDPVTETFNMTQMLPAAGQGALAVQCRAQANDSAYFAPLADRQTALAVTAERAFLSAMQGGCSVPVAAYACVSGTTLQLQGRVIAIDGARQIDVTGEITLALESADIEPARQLGRRLAEQALARGARQLLAAIPAARSASDDHRR